MRSGGRMTIRRPVQVVLLGLTLCAVSPLAAQTVEPAPDVAATSDGASNRDYLYGIALGTLGFFGGGLVGYAAASSCSGDDYCEFRGFLIGAAVGGTLGMATGVHLGNDRKGSLLLDMLTGAGVWGVGIGTAALTGWDDTATLIAAIGVPIAQLFATVAVERSTGRSREARRSLEISAGPDLQGGVTIVASLRF